MVEQPCTAGLSLLAVGDVSFRGRHEDSLAESVFEGVVSSFKEADLIVANLESPLVPRHLTSVAGKCTLCGNVDWALVLKKYGISLVTLANNHMMDYGEAGLFSTMTALDNAGIVYVGAGKDVKVARAPLLLEIGRKKIAFLARTAVDVSSRCYAEEELAGVALLEEDELLESINKCRNYADMVVVMLHWGMEEYHYPTPQQRSIARKIVSAGADILLGHHPHVLQGEELIDGAVVSYSSGNFLFDEFTWSTPGEDGEDRSYFSSLTEKNRQGMILKLLLGADGQLTTKQIFTKISEEAVVVLDDSPARHEEYRKQCAWLRLPLYERFWRLYSMKQEWGLRLSNQLSPGKVIRKFYKIRPRHFKELAIKIRRSARISSGKSTNPYEG